MNDRITSSGQVSIPASVRRRWQTRRVQVEDRGDHVVIRPVADDPGDAAYGALAGRLRMTSAQTRALAREQDGAIESRKHRELYGAR